MVIGHVMLSAVTIKFSLISCLLFVKGLKRGGSGAVREDDKTFPKINMLWEKARSTKFNNCPSLVSPL